MKKMENIDASRRAFSKLAMTFGLTAAVSPITALMLPERVMAEEIVPLRIYNPHTGDKYEVQLFEGDRWNAMGILACDWMMRDWREKETVECDRKLYAALYVIQKKFGITDPIMIHSGFRSQKTNAMLRNRSIARRNGQVTWETPAVGSQHILAKAVDFSLPGVPPREVARYVESLNLGGTGNYSTFTHMDTGRVRHWGPRP